MNLTSAINRSNGISDDSSSFYRSDIGVSCSIDEVKNDVSEKSITLFQGTTNGNSVDLIKREQSNMSIAAAIGFDGKLFLTADSRSSTTVTQKKTFREVETSLIVNDNYQKLFYVRGVAVLTVGINSFGYNRQNFKDVLKAISFEEDCSKEDVVWKIINEFFSIDGFNQKTTTISFFYFSNEHLLRWIEINSKSDNPQRYAINTEDLQNIHPEQFVPPFYWLAGASWAREFILNSDLKLGKDDDKNTEQIKKVMDDIAVASPYHDNTIGGTIRIAKLTPDGFTWLQGELESEQ